VTSRRRSRARREGFRLRGRPRAAQAFLDVAEAFARDAGPLRAVINNASVLVYEPIEQVTEETLDRMLSAGLKIGVLGRAGVPRPPRRECAGQHPQLLLAGRLPRAAEHRRLHHDQGRHRRADQGARRRARPARHPRQRDRPGQRADAGDRRLRDAGAVRAAGEEHPLRRNGTPEDVAQAAAFLLSDEAAFINGAMLAIDGGIIAAG
jgi:NAD(P)-dependent dehydrogenase (short-subunit alcohol dehydrogenase family)